MADARPGSAGVTDRRATLEALEEQLAKTPRGARPYEHAAIAYRLGLAYAESPVGAPEEGLRKALAYFDVAAAIFHPSLDPAEHARVLNAAGAAHRALGNRKKAAELFEKAATFFEGRDRDPEQAAALNNLGLVRTELGMPQEAVEAFDRAVELFDVDTPDGRRGRIAALHNRGQAHHSTGTDEGLELALADYEQARSEVDVDEAPYHNGLVQMSVGVTCSALAARRPDDRRRFLQEAATAFQQALMVFSRVGFPFQHGLAKYNLGQAYGGLGGAMNLRRALACFEDAVAVFDTRLHKEPWQHAFAALQKAEKELDEIEPGLSRAAHFARLAAEAPEEERMNLVKERMHRLLSLPGATARAGLAEMEFAIGSLGWDSREVMAAELFVIIELPQDQQEVGLSAFVDAHAQLPDDLRQEADRALDQAVGDALGGPQRVSVRDYMASIGWERP